MVITTVYRRPRELSWCMVRMAGYRERERCVIISVCDVTLLSENIQIDTHNRDVTTSKKCNSPCPLLEGPSHASPIVMVVGGRWVSWVSIGRFAWPVNSPLQLPTLLLLSRLKIDISGRLLYTSPLCHPYGRIICLAWMVMVN